MTAIDATMPRRAAAAMTWRTECLLAAAVALLVLSLHAYAGFPTLASSRGDNDSLLRLVQIRDLIAGQGWYDLHQYRMGPAGGFVMHWSRLVDAPVAAIILAASALGGSMAAGETMALVAWPLLLMAAALAFVLRIARAVGGEWTTLPALTIGGAALHFIGIFAPGNIDHHNVQLVLTLAVLAALVAGRGFAGGAIAGVACALMLAVGMETLPYVAVAGLVAALGFLRAGREQAAKACGFGIGFGGGGALAFVATVAPAAWAAAQCDAYSIPQFSIALVSGVGLAAASAFPPLAGSFARRFLALALLGVAVAAAVVLAFPQCLADPYAGLDPRLRTFWLSAITEAQPVTSVLATNWAMAASYYATPLIALAVLAWRQRGAQASPAGWVVAAFLATAFAISLWQVRGAMFSIPLGAIPLAAWVGDRRRAAASRTGGDTLRMVLAWIVSLNVAWTAAANAAAKTFGAPSSPSAQDFAGSCDRADDYAALAAEPATTVLAVSNLGAPVIRYTRHRVFAGPYHRNIAGNLLALDALMGSADAARAVVGGNAVGLVVVCRGNGETAALVEWSPQGFLAALVNGDVPAWLEKLPRRDGETLEVYRVR